jgi:hypothetical protein
MQVVTRNDNKPTKSWVKTCLNHIRAVQPSTRNILVLCNAINASCFKKPSYHCTCDTADRSCQPLWLSSACASTQSQLERTARAAVGPGGTGRTHGSGGSACGGQVQSNIRVDARHPLNNLKDTCGQALGWNVDTADAGMTSSAWL